MREPPDKSLLHKAGSLLARRPFSRAELRSRLTALATQQEVDAVLDRLEQVNLLNDADYAYNLADRWIRINGWGPAKVRELLKRRGVNDSAVEAAMDRVRGDVNDEEALERYLKRRFQKRPLPGDRKSIYRLFKHLHQRGFAEETIARVLRIEISTDLSQDPDSGE